MLTFFLGQTDALGLLKECSHIKSQPTAKDVKPLRNVSITDGKYVSSSVSVPYLFIVHLQHFDMVLPIFGNRHNAVVALCDQQAEAFEAEKYMSMAQKGPVVLLIVAVTARLFQGLD
jgi:hypothetical protein